jgi:hypothetical protein
MPDHPYDGSFLCLFTLSIHTHYRDLVPDGDEHGGRQDPIDLNL